MIIKANGENSLERIYFVKLAKTFSIIAQKWGKF